jgi:hypothetical protein
VGTESLVAVGGEDRHEDRGDFRERACAAAASSAPSLEAAIACIGRPSGVVPNFTQRARPGNTRHIDRCV